MISGVLDIILFLSAHVVFGCICSILGSSGVAYLTRWPPGGGGGEQGGKVD